MGANSVQSFSGWKDIHGHTFEDLVSFAVSGIINSRPKPYLYDPDDYPPLAIKEATKRLQSAGDYPSPRPANAEEMIEFELEFIAVCCGNLKSEIVRHNRRCSEERIARIEERFPGSFARVLSSPPKFRLGVQDEMYSAPVARRARDVQ